VKVLLRKINIYEMFVEEEKYVEKASFFVIQRHKMNTHGMCSKREELCGLKEASTSNTVWIGIVGRIMKEEI
jgi:hemerythrin